MAIAVDASSPGLKVATGTVDTITSNAFSPPAGSLVVVSGTAVFDSGTLTVTDSKSSTWTQLVTSSNLGNAITTIWCCYFASAPGSMTVSVNSSFTRLGIDVTVLTGTDTTQSGGGTLTGSPTGSTVYNGTLTTVRDNSYIVGVAAVTKTSSGTVATLTPVTNWTTDGNSTAYDFNQFRTTIGHRAVTTAAGYSAGWTASTGSGMNGAFAFAEIKEPSGPPPPQTKTATDSGTGTDTAAVSKIVLTGTENGTGTDNSSVKATNTVSETGGATDNAVVRATNVVADSGSGTEAAVSTNPVFVTDQITGSENAVLVLDQVRPATDSAIAVENAFVSRATLFVEDSISTIEAGEKSALFTPLPDARLIRVRAENRTFRVKEEK